MTVDLAVNLFSLQPEKNGTDTFEYGSAIGDWPVVIPCVVVMPALPEIPPTTPTDKAETLAEPPTVSALALLELSYRLQPFKVMVVLPWAVMAPLALRSSASTQPNPPAT